MRDSNPRHPACKAGALTTELIALRPIPTLATLRRGLRCADSIIAGKWLDGTASLTEPQVRPSLPGSTEGPHHPPCRFKKSWECRLTSAAVGPARWIETLKAAAMLTGSV